MKPATLLSFATLLGPLFASAAEGVRLERDVEYLAPGRTEKADLYLPTDPAGGRRRPAVLIIHGGGWSGGDKFAAREQNIGNTLALHGYVGMSINYVLAQQNEKNLVWPQNLHDCKTAVRWLRKNANRYQIDPDHIGAIGGSAGGHLSAMVAVTGPDAGLDPKSPYGEFSCRVQCAVDLYGPADFPSWKGKDIGAWRKMQIEDPELYRVTSPVTWVNRGDPPILILHGTADKMVPVKQSELFAAALEKAGVEHTLIVVPDAPHSFDLQPKQRDLRPLVIGFFDKHLKEQDAK